MLEWKPSVPCLHGAGKNLNGGNLFKFRSSLLGCTQQDHLIIWTGVVPSACAFCRASSVVQVTLKSPVSSRKDVCRTSTCDFVSLTRPWCAWNPPGELTESLGTWYPVFARLGFAMMISAVPWRNGVCRLYWCLNRWTFVNFHRGILTRLFLENRHGMFFN